MTSNDSPPAHSASASAAATTAKTSCSLERTRFKLLTTAISSSTTKIRPRRPETEGCSTDGAASPYSLPAIRSATRKTVPFPTSLSTVSSPPMSVTMRWQMASPSPVPTPTGFVVKNASKILPRISGAIPEPVSPTSTMTRSPSSRVLTRISLCSARPSGRACAALTMRFRNT